MRPPCRAADTPASGGTAGLRGRPVTDRTALARACAATIAAGACAPFLAHAQDVSRIVAATVYTDSAVVERQLKTPGGTRHVVIDCLPPAFDARTVQVDGDASVRLGDVRAEPVTGDAATACQRGPADARIRALEDQKAAIDAQSHADDIALDYLRRWNGNAPEPAGAHAAGPAADTLRKSALELMTDQDRLRHQAADLARQLDALQKSTHRSAMAGNWTTLRFDVSTAAAGTLHVRYQVPGAHWRMSYRAALDSATSGVRLDRQAQVTQGSGEDWTDVALTLSTGSARQHAAASLPDAWTLAPYKAPPTSAGVQRVELTGSAMPRERLAPAEPATEAIDRTPVVSLGVEERPWETLFHASQPVTMPSDTQSHTLPLDTRLLPAQVFVQLIPAQEPVAYLVAEVPRQAGAWPSGDIQVWRDGAMISTDATWPLWDDDRMMLTFGRDDLVGVTIQRPTSMTVATGFFGGRTQRSWGTVFVVTNRHATPQKVQLIDASPVSEDESVKVVSTFEPAPTLTNLDDTPGVDAWVFTIGPHQSQKIGVSQVVTFPKDARIRNLPGG